jgi:uncharacterized protein DUF4238
MSEPVDHHYVPEFYLRLWEGSDKKICRYHRPHSNVVTHRISPSHTGYEPQLYALHSHPSETRQTIEKEFFSQAIDDPAATALRSLLAKPAVPLTREVREAWIRFLLSLAVRHPEGIASARATGGEILRRELSSSPSEEYAAVRGNVPETTLLEFVEARMPGALQDLGLVSLPSVISDLRLGQAIWEMHWYLLNLSASRFRLLTSDRPLLIQRGLGDPRCYIALPLGPSVAFVATRDKRIFEELANRHLPQEIARALNETFVSQAVKHVYGLDDSHLRFVEKHLGRSPTTP